MFVGTTGVERVAQRTCEVMLEHGLDHDQLEAHGVISLPLIQKYINLHYSVSLDLFGSELSTNAATYYNNGLKGRFRETKRDDDHILRDDVYKVLEPTEDGRIVETMAPALNAMNACLQDDYITDCAKGMQKWNKVVEDAGIDFRFTLPHRGFHRAVGLFAGQHIAPDGTPLTKAQWEARVDDFLPTAADTAYVGSLMTPVTEIGKMANWIAPPKAGINGQPVAWEYVKFAPRD